MDQNLAEQLMAILPDTTVLTTAAPEFGSYNARWSEVWHKEAVSIPPPNTPWSRTEYSQGAVVIPHTAVEIATIVRFATKHSIDLAVVSGGHGERGCSSTTGGLLISLSEMRSIVVRQLDRTIIIQGGALWIDVYKELSKFGLGVVGGVCDSVGVGGLTLAGGYGWLTGRHGLALDNLLFVEAVLADGSIVSASLVDNPDLFWALRGAGPAFAIVTTFKLQAHIQDSPCWAGELYYPPLNSTILYAFAEVIDKILTASDGNSALFMRWEFDTSHQGPRAVADVFHNGPESEAMAFFAPLLIAHPRYKTTRMRSFSDCGHHPTRAPGGMIFRKGSSLISPVKVDFLQELWDDFNTFVKKTDFTDSILLWDFHNMRRVLMIQQSETAFPNRGVFGNFMVLPIGRCANDVHVLRDWACYMAAKCKKQLEIDRAGNKSLDNNTRCAVGEYVNYDGIGESARDLFGLNFPRLMALKRTYDPFNVFNKFVDFDT